MLRMTILHDSITYWLHVKTAWIILDLVYLGTGLVKKIVSPQEGLYKLNFCPLKISHHIELWYWFEICRFTFVRINIRLISYFMNLKFSIMIANSVLIT
jgi:hypothetical protein